MKIPNWIIEQKNPQLSLIDKLKLLKKPSNKVKMVLIQQHEIENITINHKVSVHKGYIEYLFDHYVINNLPKTYLC